MRFSFVSKLCLACLFACFYLPVLKAQQPVKIDSAVAEHIFTWGEISSLEDPSGKLSFPDVLLADSRDAFQVNKIYYPRNRNRKSAYWFKVKVNLAQLPAKQQSLIEFFDQTTDEITAYLPERDGRFTSATAGASINFQDRLYQHKNFEFIIPNRSAGAYTYYFRVRSSSQVNVIIVYRTIDRFIHYALVEYITYGLFYGMILVFCLHNLLMFMATRLKQYLYYVFYTLSVGVYEMSSDGIAFQFIWPNAPAWNEFAYGVALYSMSIFALVFTQTLLQVKQRNTSLFRLLQWTIAARTVFFAACLFINHEWFLLKIIEIVPLSVAFITGVIIYRQGFKPARFFVLGYTLLLAGAIMKLVTVLGLARSFPGAIGHYSVTFGFMMEMVLLSFSISDQVRLLRKDKDRAQDEAMRQMQINAQLQVSINQQLEQQVAERTHELVIKSRQIQDQAEEISRMNVLLEKDNTDLKINIEKITEARIESTELTFEEFSQKYPDREHCCRLLAELKWKSGFKCKKCGYENYSAGRGPFSRRCNRCTYEESAMYDTIFENNRIPINKAFYIAYLVYTTKGAVSSHQMAEKLGIRQSTCWAYAIKVKAAMDDALPKTKRSKRGSWTDMIVKSTKVASTE